MSFPMFRDRPDFYSSKLSLNDRRNWSEKFQKVMQTYSKFFAKSRMESFIFGKNSVFFIDMNKFLTLILGSYCFLAARGQSDPDELRIEINRR